MINVMELKSRLSRIARETVEALDRHPIARKLVGGTMSFPEYDHYLAQVAYQIRGTGEMLATAAVRLDELEKPRLAGLFRAKSKEEDHDEWPSHDRAALVPPGEAPASIPPSPAVLSYRAFTWFLAGIDPVALLGVAYILETLGERRAGEAAENLVRHSQIPRVQQALRFLRGHGAVDHDHRRALEVALEEDVRDAAEADKILLAARVTAWMYLAFFVPVPSSVETSA